MSLQGRHWCPACCAVQDFILAEGASPQEPEPDLECWVCGWLAGKIQVESVGGRRVVRPWFGKDDRARGRARLG